MSRFARSHRFRVLDPRLLRRESSPKPVAPAGVLRLPTERALRLRIRRATDLGHHHDAGFAHRESPDPGRQAIRRLGAEHMREIGKQFGPQATITFREELAEMANAGLLEATEHTVKLTDRGRLVSNEVFERLIGSSAEK